MKTILFILLSTLLITACDDNFHDTGKANGNHNCSMLQYMQSDPNNWSLTVQLINRAGLEKLFMGQDPSYPLITFFGPANSSIRQFLYKTTDTDGERLYNGIDDIPADLCREILLSYVVKDRIMRSDIAFEIKGTLDGGTPLTTLSGATIRAYRYYTGRPNIDPDGMGFNFVESGHMGFIASGDINTLNGVVHSLADTYQLANPVIK